MKYLSKGRVFLILLLVGFLAFRLVLPYVVLRYVEHQINKIPEYRVTIQDLDMHLYRGAYTIKNIQLWKIKENIPVPFFEAQKMDFSIEWRALLHGKIVAKILVKKPRVNFVIDPSKKNTQTSINKQWIDIVKTLYPANINRLEAMQGEISLRSMVGKNPFKIYIKNVNFMIENMQKTVKKDKVLSSSFLFRGETVGKGSIYLKGDFAPFSKEPTLKMSTQLKNLEVAQISQFLKHFSSVDVENGTFSLYSEIAVASGSIKGYIKPFIKHLKIGEPKDNKLISHVIDGAAKVMSKILENKRKNTIATQINISGTTDEPDTNILSIIGFFIRHAFIQALLPQIDHSIKMQDIFVGKNAQQNTFLHYKNT